METSVSTPLVAETTAIGVVLVQGADPRPQFVLQTSSGKRWTLVGALTPELAQLAGARVSVHGRATAQPPPDTAGISVESYDILEVAGAKPIVGRIRQRAGLVFVDTTQLGTPPPELAQAVGAKVWVVGRPGPDGFVVTSYGILAVAVSDSQ